MKARVIYAAVGAALILAAAPAAARDDLADRANELAEQANELQEQAGALANEATTANDDARAAVAPADETVRRTSDDDGDSGKWGLLGLLGLAGLLGLRRREPVRSTAADPLGHGPRI